MRCARSIFVRRFAGEAVRTALCDTRVVAWNGARQVGTSTLGRTIVAESPGALETMLDDAATRATATMDPTSSVRPHGLLLIGEVQRAPDLLLSVKAQVDRDPRPGQYLVAGSAAPPGACPAAGRPRRLPRGGRAP